MENIKKDVSIKVLVYICHILQCVGCCALFFDMVSSIKFLPEHVAVNVFLGICGFCAVVRLFIEPITILGIFFGRVKK